MHLLPIAIGILTVGSISAKPVATITCGASHQRVVPRSVYMELPVRITNTFTEVSDSQLSAAIIALEVEVIQELRCWAYTGNEQMIPRTGAGDVEQVPFRVINFLKIGVITDGLDTFLQGDDLVIAGHDYHGTEFQTLC